MSNNEKYNTAKLSEREIASAVFRLSEARFAKTDFELLKSLKPSAANDPQYRFSPSRYHNYILRELLQLKSEKDIIAARCPPIEEETPPAEEETPPAEGEKTTSESATVPGSSAAGQNIKSAAGQNKKKSQKKTNTPTSTGKTSSTKTSSGQS